MYNANNGVGNWIETTPPVRVNNTQLFCGNYSSALLPSTDGQRVLELAGDYSDTGCHVYYNTGPIAYAAAAPVAGNTYYLESVKHPGYRLHASNESYQSVNGTYNALVSSFTPGDVHQWKLADAGNGSFYLESVKHPGYRLQSTGELYQATSGTRNAALTNFTPPNEGHRWRFVDASGGNYYLESANAPGYRLHASDEPYQNNAGTFNTLISNYFPSDVHRWRLQLVSRGAQNQGSTLAVAVATPGEAEPQLYPNPARGSLRVRLPAGWAGGPASLALYDGLGRAVLRAEGVRTGQRVDLGRVPAGLYHAQLRQGSHRATLRLAVE